MIECIGIQERSGSFTPEGQSKEISFDNVMIFYVTDDNPDVIGYYGKEIKVSKNRIQKVNFQSWDELIGKEISFIYNIFGNVPRLTGIQILCEGHVTELLTKIHTGNIK